MSTVHLLFPFVAILLVPDAGHAADTQRRLLFGGISCMSCSSHCHGTDIQEEVGTQLSVRGTIVLFALSVGQVTRKEGIY